MAAMKEMFREVIQQVMEVDMDEELERVTGENSSPNYHNGYPQKMVKTRLGAIDIRVSRDRKGNYEPKIVGKYDCNAEGMEDKILALYVCGMRQRDIAEQIRSLYDVETSPEPVSKISAVALDEAEENQRQFSDT